MVEIVSSVGQVSRLIGEIATATAEQNRGIGQANTAVGELDKATQQNAALVEESTAASESLRRLAEELAQAVRVFRLAEFQTPQLAAAAPAPLRAARKAAHRLSAARHAIVPAGPAALAASAAGATVEEWKEF